MVGPPTARVAETEARLHAVPEWPVKNRGCGGFVRRTRSGSALLHRCRGKGGRCADIDATPCAGVWKWPFMTASSTWDWKNPKNGASRLEALAAIWHAMHANAMTELAIIYPRGL